MDEKQNYRKERVERLLHELEYEITRGMLEGDLDEHMSFRFIVPVSKKMANGVVHCEFRTRPMDAGAVCIDDAVPRLRVVS